MDAAWEGAGTPDRTGDARLEAPVAAPAGGSGPARVFDVDAIRRVPGGIASHRMTLELLGPESHPPAPG